MRGSQAELLDKLLKLGFLKMTGWNVRVVAGPGSSISRILDRFYPEVRPLPPGDVLGGSIGRE